jgi:AraC-like DNA-binding protein
VAAVWSYAAGAASSSLIAADGCFDLILEADGRCRMSAFVYAPVTRAHHAHVEAGTRLFGVRLRPGYAAALIDSHTNILRAVERHAIAEARPDELESIVMSAVEDHSRPPNIVADFIAQARAAAGALRLTSPSSTSRERELQRECRRWLGLTPKAFLRIERAWAARDAIREGGPLAMIAADFGYADQAHLTRDVRELLGVTPRQLRPVGILQDPARPNR